MIVRTLTGIDLERALPALAHLRIQVLRAFPYLYAGTTTREQAYMRSFGAALDALIVVAETDHGNIVGCATGSALTRRDAAFASPLENAGYSLASTFYFGESVLLPAYRGRGLGNAFFDAREAHAVVNGYKRACFCAVERPADHPARPANYRPLDAFWTKRGYRKLPDATCQFDWPETEHGPDLPHPMNYWLRTF
ncbi:GNAT family N-acetyltransferase [Hyphomonas johnsonii]|uniref:Acetyltransferase n=1 Tax=Hyphomonas johnsonii MHS-2 TaxID=1280950 RepID=A0A059FTJ1_9PROT|nr:GNAT family N-acetyltransferase [Hyphomonas johnsonii]KCZ93979.1 acetyltransferase [Hyphomonas johnsonii MHS-2]